MMGGLCQVVASVRMKRDSCSLGMCQQTSSKISTPNFIAGIPHPETLFSSAVLTPSFATLAHSASRQDLS